MSQPPSFDQENPEIIIRRPEDIPAAENKKPEEDKNICSLCVPPREFDSAGGLGSHRTFKHKDADNDEMNKQDVSLQEIYDSNDFIRILVPNNNQTVYDRSKNIWVYTVGGQIPEGYALYSIGSRDKIHEITDTNKTRRSFTELVCVRKDKVIKL